MKEEKHDLGKPSASLRLNCIFRDAYSILFHFRMHRAGPVTAEVLNLRCITVKVASQLKITSEQTFTQLRNRVWKILLEKLLIAMKQD